MFDTSFVSKYNNSHPKSEITKISTLRNLFIANKISKAFSNKF
jgi:hypothetical protein